MKRAFILLLIFCYCGISLNAQVLRGKITNASGEPVPYATIYIKELRQGTSANTMGDYEIKLPAGNYIVTYQSMGYAPQYFTISIAESPLRKDVTLQMQYYQIPEVRITATGEDPAYGIMRKAIGMAPYYLNCVKHYKSEVYIKGSLVVQKIPALLKSLMKKAAKEDGNEEINISEGSTYMMESFNEVEFTSPDKYDKKVISYNSTFPETEEKVSPMDLIDASFYSSSTISGISPLSSQAFSYYRFKYLGATLQGDYSINKIQVIPKIKSQQLFEGTIYIIEGLWCLQSVDLVLNNMVGTINISQIYIPVKDDIWLPVTHKFEVDARILGIKAAVGYGSSIRYLDVTPNEELHKPESVTVNYFAARTDIAEKETPVNKNQQKIQEILDKKDMSNSDMIRLARLMQKESKETLPDSVKNNLEIKNNTTTTIEKDAARKDSSYWASMRPIPLTADELNSIVRRDSIKKENILRVAVKDSTPKTPAKRKSKFSRGMDYIVSGHTWQDTTGFSFNFDGLINLKSLSFNTVDGFNYGTGIRFTKTWKNNNSLTVAPQARWAFSRQKLNWRVSTVYSFDRLKQRQIFLRGGITSSDISDGGSINTFLNSISTLFFKDNYLKLYHSAYLTAGYRAEIINGLNLEISAGFDDRKLLTNNTSWSVVRSSKEYTDNIPDNEYLAAGSNPLNALRDHMHYEIVTNVTYTPRQRYSFYNKAKVNRGSDWPTFSFTWKHGINEFADPEDKYKSYDLLKMDITRTRTAWLTSTLTWRLSTGGFLNNRYVDWFDFIHFNAQPLPVLIDNYFDAFRLPSYYSLATPEFFGEAHIQYSTPYLLLKYLPGFSKTNARENLSLSYLGTRFHENYTEVGYSIVRLFIFGEIGVYAGFDNLKFRSAGLRIGFNLN